MDSVRGAGQPELLYEQIERDLREQITSGTLAPGDKLPPELELCERYGVSRITARRAVQNLTDDGLVYRLRGRGSFVSKPKAEIRNDQNQNFVIFQSYNRAGIEMGGILEQKVMPASPDVAKRLEISPGSPVYYTQRLFVEDDIPHAYNELYVAKDTLPDLNEALQSGASLFDLETNYYHVTLGPEEIQVEVTNATERIAQFLSCETGCALFLLHIILRNDKGTVIHYSRLYMRGDRTLFSFKVGPDGRFVG